MAMVQEDLSDKQEGEEGGVVSPVLRRSAVPLDSEMGEKRGNSKKTVSRSGVGHEGGEGVKKEGTFLTSPLHEKKAEHHRRRSWKKTTGTAGSSQTERKGRVA